MEPFDPARFAKRLIHGHNGRLGIAYHAHGPDWVELALPHAADQVGDPDRGTVATGPIVTLVDLATSLAIWTRRGRFVPHATLDLRLDHLRTATPGTTLVARGTCIRIARQVAFVRAEAHDGDPADPVAHAVGTFMLTEHFGAPAA